MQFDGTFFDSMGMESLDKAKKDALAQQLTQLTQDRITLKIAEKLSDDELDEYEKIADDKGDEAAMDYIAKVLPDYQAIVDAEVKDVVSSFLNDMIKLVDHQKQSG